MQLESHETSRDVSPLVLLKAPTPLFNLDLSKDRIALQTRHRQEIEKLTINLVEKIRESSLDSYPTMTHRNNNNPASPEYSKMSPYIKDLGSISPQAKDIQKFQAITDVQIVAQELQKS